MCLCMHVCVCLPAVCVSLLAFARVSVYVCASLHFCVCVSACRLCLWVSVLCLAVCVRVGCSCVFVRVSLSLCVTVRARTSTRVCARVSVSLCLHVSPACPRVLARGLSGRGRARRWAARRPARRPARRCTCPTKTECQIAQLLLVPRAACFALFRLQVYVWASASVGCVDVCLCERQGCGSSQFSHGRFPFGLADDDIGRVCENLGHLVPPERELRFGMHPFGVLGRHSGWSFRQWPLHVQLSRILPSFPSAPATPRGLKEDEGLARG